MHLHELLNDATLSRRITRKILWIITFTVLLIFGLFHLNTVLLLLNNVLRLFQPFLTGIAIAFVLNVLVKLYEERVFGALKQKDTPLWNKIGRAVCVFLSIITIVLIFTGLIRYVVPELINSTHILTEYININAPIFVKQITLWANQTLLDFSVTSEQLQTMGLDWASLISRATQFTTDFMTSLLSITVNFASGIISFVMSFIFALYMLFDKEHLIGALKRILYAFLPEKHASSAIHVGSLANRIFTGFVTGQVTEAVIIGLLCYAGLSILRLPYALLISVIISLTALIPILGAYLGGCVGALILLIVNPIYALWFLIFLIALQQFEGNLIYPRVVGTSIGLPGIWVMLSILVWGNLFSVPGILIGVPATSVLYTLLRTATKERLEEKGISNEEVMTGISPAEPAKLDTTTEAPAEDSSNPNG